METTNVVKHNLEFDPAKNDEDKSLEVQYGPNTGHSKLDSFEYRTFIDAVM